MRRVSPVGQLPAARVDRRVEPGPDQVAGSGVVAVGQGGARLGDGAEQDQFGLDAAGQVSDLGVGPGEQQDVLAAQVVGEPHARSPVQGGVVVGGADLAVPVVGGEVPRPQPHRGVDVSGKSPMLNVTRTAASLRTAAASTCRSFGSQVIVSTRFS
jgi:hypothetical protein